MNRRMQNDKGSALGSALALLISALLSICLLGTAHAVIEAETFDSPQLEQRYTSLIKELRCLVCQNQSLADSDADLAQDLRGLTADMLRDGKSDDDIRAFMRERYGDFVLYRTPFTSATAFIWIAPMLALLLGLLLFFLKARKRVAVNTEEDLDPAALERAKSLLNSSGSENK